MASTRDLSTSSSEVVNIRSSGINTASIAKLTKDNYGRWADKASAILRKEKLWKYILPKAEEASIPVPSNEQELLNDAADTLTLMISDTILDRLTKEEKTDGRKLWAGLEVMLQPGGV